jgi:hypothetical protein
MVLSIKNPGHLQNSSGLVLKTGRPNKGRKGFSSQIFFKKPLTWGKKYDKKGWLSRVKKIFNIINTYHSMLPD